MTLEEFEQLTDVEVLEAIGAFRLPITPLGRPNIVYASSRARDTMYCTGSVICPTAEELAEDRNVYYWSVGTGLPNRFGHGRTMLDATHDAAEQIRVLARPLLLRATKPRRRSTDRAARQALQAARIPEAIKRRAAQAIDSGKVVLLDLERRKKRRRDGASGPTAGRRTRTAPKGK